MRLAHKAKGFAGVVQEAASLGRLTRLNEQIVEAEGRKAAPKKSRRASVVATNLMDIQWKTTHHGSVCNDIVELGQLFRGKEVVTESSHPGRSAHSFDSGWGSTDSDDFDEFGGEESGDEDGGAEVSFRRPKRPSQIEGLVQRVKEEDKEKNTRILQHLQSQHADDFELPEAPAPRAHSIIRRQQNNPCALRRGSMGTITRTLAEDVIEEHSRRQSRVEKGQLHMKGQCSCPYCYTASPFQTYAYKKALENQKGGTHTWVRQNGDWSRITH